MRRIILSKAKYFGGKRLASTRGSEIAEAALVLPLALLILLAIYWFGRAFNVYATINHAAREGARTAVVSSCGSCFNPNPNSPPAFATIAATITADMLASHVDPGQIQAYTPSVTGCPPPSPALACSASGTINNITICNNVQLVPSRAGAPAVCGVSVTFQYPYQFSLPFAVPPYGANAISLQLKTDVQMQGEY